MWQFAQGGRRDRRRLPRARTCRSPAATSASTTRPTARAIYPTPIIGVVGLLEHADRVVSRRFQESGDAIVLLGEGRGELGGSEYLKVDARSGARRAAGAGSGRRARAADAAGDAGGRAADAVGARLLRRRPGGDARRVRFDTGGIGAEVSLDGVAGVARRGDRTSRRRCSASRRRAWSCRSCPSSVTTVLRHAAAAQRAGARHRPDRRQPAADRGRRRRS